MTTSSTAVDAAHQKVSSISNIRTWMAGVQQAVLADGNAEVAQKIDELVAQVSQDTNQVTVAFCGLFSAGKSSLLNALCQTDKLATGAVPTTAEVHALTLPGTNDTVVLVDTPGVDSTDDAHQAETENMLHRAHVVVLVMDYQHVEAEGNLEFAQALSEQGKQLWLVINQIDKHLDFELTFDEFLARVRRSFADWDIVFEHLFTTSNQPSAHNQLDALRDELAGLQGRAREVSTAGVVQGVEELVRAHVQRKYEARVSQMEARLKEMLGYVPDDEREAREWLAARCETLETLQTKRQQAFDELARQFDEMLASLSRSIDLAQISPYETTELGRRFVESMKPGFKVGWFRASEKTAQEQSHRLRAFQTELQERTTKFLVWPIQSQLRDFAGLFTTEVEQWLPEVEQMSVTIDPAQLKSVIKDGALESESYPYQYVKDVVAQVKTKVKNEVVYLHDRWFKAASTTLQERLAPELHQESKLQRESDALTEALALMGEQAATLEHLLRGNEQSGGQQDE